MESKTLQADKFHKSLHVVSKVIHPCVRQTKNLSLATEQLVEKLPPACKYCDISDWVWIKVNIYCFCFSVCCCVSATLWAETWRAANSGPEKTVPLFALGEQQFPWKQARKMESLSQPGAIKTYTAVDNVVNLCGCIQIATKHNILHWCIKSVNMISVLYK